MKEQKMTSADSDAFQERLYTQNESKLNIKDTESKEDNNGNES
jgi:hypothetical protein